MPKELLLAKEVRLWRGFIDHLAIDASQLGWPLLELAPALTSLELRCQTNDLGLDAPVFDQIRSLRIYVDARSGRAPFFPPREATTTNIRALSLPQNIGLLDHPRFAHLEELSIAGSNDRRAPEKLIALPYQPKRLNVAHVAIGDAGWKMLAPWLAELEVLNARDTGVTDETLMTHLNPNVRALDLSGNELGDAAVEVLCSRFRDVEFLDVRGSLSSHTDDAQRLRDTFGERVIH